MAKSKGIIGYGTTLSINAAVAEVISITPSKRTRTKVDLTNLTSPDGYKEKTGGLRDCEDVQVTIMYEKTQRDALEEAFESDEELACIITYPDGATDTLNAIMTELAVGQVTAEDKIVTTIALAPTGKIAYTPPVAP